MIKVKLNSLKIKNFMGYAGCEYNFNDSVTEILGESGNGKTSLENAWRWVLGLNIEDFAPKINGYRVKNLETSVVASINVKGSEYNLMRIATQKFNKKSGEFEKYDYAYEIDSMPLKSTQYTKMLEDLFKLPFAKFDLIFSLKAFNNDVANKWTWKNRREELFDKLNIKGKTTELADNEDFDLIADNIRKGYSDSDIQTILNNEKKAIEKQQALNLHDIDNAKAELIKYSSIDFSSLRSAKERLTNEIAELQQQTLQSSKQQLINAKAKEINELNVELIKIQQADNSKLQSWSKDKSGLEYSSQSLENQKSILVAKLKQITDDLQDLEIETDDLKKSTIDPSKNICSLCGQELPQNKKNEILATFESDRVKQLATMTARASNLTVERQNTQDRINALLDKESVLKSKLEWFNANEPQSTDTTEIQEKIKTLTADIENLKTKAIKNEVAELIAEKQNELYSIIGELKGEETKTNILTKIESLKNDSKKLSNDLALNNCKQEQLKAYIEQEVKMIDTEIGKYFVGINFNFFSWNSAKVENPYDPTCEVIFNGTVYASQSGGQKIFSDLAVNNGLQKLYFINVPQFVDNMQDITYNIEGDCQQIRLVTDKFRFSVETYYVCNTQKAKNWLIGEYNKAYPEMQILDNSMLYNGTKFEFLNKKLIATCDNNLNYNTILVDNIMDKYGIKATRIKDIYTLSDCDIKE